VERANLDNNFTRVPKVDVITLTVMAIRLILIKVIVIVD